MKQLSPLNPLQELQTLASLTAARLLQSSQQLVLAESCTGGLVAAMLSETPGISARLCGSAVVYQEATKQAWAGVTPQSLARWTAVSEVVAAEMALGVLEQTPQASLGISVTGWLGPGAAPPQDGLVYSATALRTGDVTQIVRQSGWRLPRYDNQPPSAQRRWRQQLVARLVLGEVLATLAACP